MKDLIKKGGMEKMFFLAVLLCVCASTSAICCVAGAPDAMIISEIMYNPPGTDNNHEFVEIYGTDNLSGYMIGDDSGNDSLALMKHVPGNISIIVEEGFYDSWNGSAITASIYSAGASIGDGLGNSGDTIFLYFNGALIDSLTYDGASANGDGHSLEKCFVEWTDCSQGIWHESRLVNGTPGFIYVDMENIGQPDENETAEFNITMNISNATNCINLTEDVGINYTDADMTNNTIINDTAIINDTIFNHTAINETVIDDTIANITNLTTACSSITISASVEGRILSEGSISYKHHISPQLAQYEIEYWIEDIKGAVIKDKTITKNTNEKSYTPKYDKGINVIYLKARLLQEGCEGNASDLQLIINGTAPAEKTCAVCTQTKTSCPKQSCPACKETAIKDTEGKTGTQTRTALSIESFYTRQKKWNQNLTLFSTIHGYGEIEIWLFHGKHVLMQNQTINGSMQVSFIINDPEPEAYYLLSAKGEGQQGQRDFKGLYVNLTIEEHQQDITQILKAGVSGVSGKTGTERAGPDTPYSQSANRSSSSNELTGTIIYETTTQRLLRNSVWIIIILAIIAVVLLYRFRKGNRQETKSEEEEGHFSTTS